MVLLQCLCSNIGLAYSVTKSDETYKNFDESKEAQTVLLHNGGSCNACTMKRCITFRCITKQTTLLNVAIT
jgi:hypothetical protein